MVELRIHISKSFYKYISLENCSPVDWNEESFNQKYTDLKTKYNNVLIAMQLLGVPLDLDTFNQYAGLKDDSDEEPLYDEMPIPNQVPIPNQLTGINYYAYPQQLVYGQENAIAFHPIIPNHYQFQPIPLVGQTRNVSSKTASKSLMRSENSEPNGVCKKSSVSDDFLRYMEDAIKKENIQYATFKHKRTTVDLLKKFGKIRKYSDLTPGNILSFDEWLRDGTRSDVTVSGYHKVVKMYVHKLHIAEIISSNPYDRVKIKRGRNKEREPLTEDELKALRLANLTGKLDRVRDLFIFSAYTGLSYADAQLFDYKTMTEKLGDMYYIDGERVKTGSKYFTPILGPAMKVLKKYNYKLPRISNQKGNDYLHIIQDRLQIRKKMTFHVARHSFATMCLTNGCTIEEVCKMLGHHDIRTTQIYAKILKTTIMRTSEALFKNIR